MQNSEALSTPWFCLPVEGQLPGSYLPSLRGSLWSLKARPTMLHLGYKWALHFSDRVWPLLHLFFHLLSLLRSRPEPCLGPCLAWRADTAFSLWISRGRALPTALPWLLSFPSAALLLLSQTSTLKGPGHFLHHPSGPGEPPRAKMISPPPLKGPCPSFTPYHMLPWIIAGCFCLRAWLALRAEIRSYSSLYPPRCLA